MADKELSKFRDGYYSREQVAEMVTVDVAKAGAAHLDQTERLRREIAGLKQLLAAIVLTQQGGELFVYDKAFYACRGATLEAYRDERNRRHVIRAFFDTDGE